MPTPPEDSSAVQQGLLLGVASTGAQLRQQRPNPCLSAEGNAPQPPSDNGAGPASPRAGGQSSPEIPVCTTDALHARQSGDVRQPSRLLVPQASARSQHPRSPGTASRFGAAAQIDPPETNTQLAILGRAGWAHCFAPKSKKHHKCSPVP